MIMCNIIYSYRFMIANMFPNYILSSESFRLRETRASGPGSVLVRDPQGFAGNDGAFPFEKEINHV